MKKRLLSLLLVLVMAFSLLPTTAFADYIVIRLPIQYVEVTGIDVPVEGELPDREVELPEGVAYTVGAPENFAQSFINGVAWVDLTTDEYMKEGEVFIAGHDYYPVIGLKAMTDYSFASINTITGKTNLSDEIDVAGFYGAEESEYVCVYLGTMQEPYSVQPLPKYSITTVNCEAYNEKWEKITSAKAGEFIRVYGIPEYEGQPFYSWTIDPRYPDDLGVGDGYLQFTMPAQPVYLEATYLQKVLITTENGKAYDEAGNVITEALPGTKVYLEPDEPAFGMAFAEWYLVSEGDVTVEQEGDGRYYITVPYSNVHATAIFYELPPVPLESLTLTLNGYYINANANCLQVGASEGVHFVTNPVTELNYIVLADNAGMPSTTQVTGALRNTAKHWIGVTVEADFGYSLDGLTADMVAASFAEKILVATNEDGTVSVLMLVTYPGRPLIKKTITVTNGGAFINSTAVTSTVPGMKVTVQSIEVPAGQFFAGWKVISGNVELEDPMNLITSFTMGSTDVELEAIFRDYISCVELEIQKPQAGMTPSYLGKIESGSNYMLDPDSVNNRYYKNGIAWYDVDTEELLDPATAVFQPGHCYGLQILLRAKDGQKFNLNESGYPAVTGYVNGVSDAVYVDQYTMDSSIQVILTTSFYIEEDAEIVPPVTQINISIDDPVPGMILDYTPEWDYMEYISPYSAQDNDDTLNGVTWTDVTAVPHVVMQPETDVAVQGQTYRVDMLICTTNNRIFAVDEYGMPSIQATVNGQTCDVTVVNGLDSTRYLLLMYYVQAEPAPKLVKWAGTNVVLGGALALNFALDASQLNGTTGNYIVLTRSYADGRADDIVTIPQSEWVSAGGNYMKVSYTNLAAKEMGDVITAVVYNADGKVISEIRTDSIASYALRMLKDNKNAEQRTLFVDMLNYGAAAQVYFEYNEENLVNAELTEEQAGWASQTVEINNYREIGGCYVGSNLSLVEEIFLQVAFKAAYEEGMCAKISFTDHYGKVKEQTVGVTKDGNYVIVRVEGMAIADYRGLVTCTLYGADGTELGYTIDSMESYVARMGLGNLGDAIMKLGASSYAYFH